MENKPVAEAAPRYHTTYPARGLPQPRVSKEKEVRGGLSTQHSLKPVTCLAWSCDGKRLATGSQERQIRVWDAVAKFDISRSQILSAPSASSPSTGNIAAIAFSPTDPDTLVCTTKLSDKSPNIATVWNVKDPAAPLATFNLPSSSLRIAFHPSGRQFAVVCEHGSRDQALFFWFGPHGPDGSATWALREDIHMGCAGVDLGVSLDEFHGFVFSHSGKVIFTGSANGGLNAWKFRENPPPTIVSNGTSANGPTVPLPRSVIRLAEGGDTETPNSPRSRTPAPDAVEDEIEEAGGPTTGQEDAPVVNVSLDEETAAIGHTAVNSETSEPVDEPPAATSNAIAPAVGNADGDAMEIDPVPVETSEDVKERTPTPAVTPAASVPASPQPETPTTETGKDDWAKQLTLLKQTPVHILNCYAIDLCPTGRYIATGGADAMINLYETRDWIGVKTFQALPGIVDHLSFSHDGEYLAASGDDRAIYIFSPHTGTIVQRIPTLGAVSCIAWSPERNTLAYCTKSLTASAATSGWWLVHVE